MTKIEVLDESVSWPFSIPVGRGNYDGVPPSIADFGENAKPWHLVGWKDSNSNTIGIARKNQAIALDSDDVDALSICFMRSAKGPGFVSLEAILKETRRPLVLFEVTRFDQDALVWLRGKARQIEVLFGVSISENDYGADY